MFPEPDFEPRRERHGPGAVFFLSLLQALFDAGRTKAPPDPLWDLALLEEDELKDSPYQDSYRLGEPLVVTEEALTVSDVPLEGETQACYRFTDLYGQHHWTPALGSR